MRSISSTPSNRSSGVSFLIVLVVIAVLYFAKSILIPIALAIMLSFMLGPFVSKLERWHIPRMIAIFLTTIGVACLFWGFGTIVAVQVSDLTSQLPQYEGQYNQKLAAFEQSTVGKAVISAFQKWQIKEGQSETPEGDNLQNAAPNTTKEKNNQPRFGLEMLGREPWNLISSFLGSAFGSVFGFLEAFLIVIVFTLFILFQRNDLRDRIIHLLGRGNLSVTMRAMNDAGRRVTRYLVMLTLVNTSIGIFIWIGLKIAGVPNSGLWGLLSGLLRFIPYIGIWISAIFPFLLSLTISNSWAMPLACLGIYVVAEIIFSNFVEPITYGSSTGLSPIAILIAAIFWTWLWGTVGLLLATPITVCATVIGKYIPSLEFIPTLLGDEPAMDVEQRFYQRLLAKDVDEAQTIAEDYLTKHNKLELYSNVFVPTLGTAKREETAGDLEASTKQLVYENLRELVENFDTEFEKKGESKAKAQPQTSVNVVCLPAIDEADEIVAVMLAQLLEDKGFKSESVSYKALANEMVEQVLQSQSNIICISVTPPYDLLHTRYLVKLLRTRLPEAKVFVGLWEGKYNPKHQDRYRQKLDANRLVNSPAEMIAAIRPFVGLAATHIE